MSQHNPQPLTPERFDVRIQDHQIRRGELTRQEVDAHLAEIQDDAQHAVDSTVRFVPTWASRHGRRR